MLKNLNLLCVYFYVCLLRFAPLFILSSLPACLSPFLSLGVNSQRPDRESAVGLHSRLAERAKADSPQPLCLECPHP